MFEVNQVWANGTGKTIVISGDVGGAHVFVTMLTGRKTGARGWVSKSLVLESFHQIGTLIGNKYTPLERPTAKGLPEQRGCRKEDC